MSGGLADIGTGWGKTYQHRWAGTAGFFIPGILRSFQILPIKSDEIEY
jgi:hypothetical protein